MFTTIGDAIKSGAQCAVIDSAVKDIFNCYVKRFGDEDFCFSDLQDGEVVVFLDALRASWH